MSFTVLHELRCECGADLTNPDSVKVHFSVADHEFDKLSCVDEHGQLYDILDANRADRGLIHSGYHSGSYCVACGEQIEELDNGEIPQSQFDPNEIDLLLSCLEGTRNLALNWHEELLEQCRKGVIPKNIQRAMDMISSFSRERESKEAHADVQNNAVVQDLIESLRIKANCSSFLGDQTLFAAAADMISSFSREVFNQTIVHGADSKMKTLLATQGDVGKLFSDLRGVSRLVEGLCRDRGGEGNVDQIVDRAIDMITRLSVKNSGDSCMEAVGLLVTELRNIQTSMELIRNGEEDAIGLVLRQAIEVITKFSAKNFDSREICITGTVEGGLLSIDALPEGVTLDIRDYDTDGIDEDALSTDDGGQTYFNVG